MDNASTVEMALLGLLRGKPQSGYDLRKTFTTTPMRHYSDSPGSIYPALRRLESRGWISGTGSTPADDRRRRQEFVITDKGTAVLVAWLEQEVSEEHVRLRFSELMLRFAFMDGNIPRSATVRFLDQLSGGLAGYLGEMRAKFEEMSSKVPSLHTGLLAFESGIRSMEAQLVWVREARARLGEGVK